MLFELWDIEWLGFYIEWLGFYDVGGVNSGGAWRCRVSLRSSLSVAMKLSLVWLSEFGEKIVVWSC